MKRTNDSLRSIIAREVYNGLDNKLEFEIKNGVRTTYKKYFDLNTLEYVSENKSLDNENIEIHTFYRLSDKLKTEIYNEYRQSENDNNFNHESDISKIKILISHAISKAEKIEVLKRQRKKVLDKLSEIKLYQDYNESKGDFNIKSRKFTDFITEHFESSILDIIFDDYGVIDDYLIGKSNIYIDYITDDDYFYFQKYWFFREADQIYTLDRILSFIEKSIDEIKKKGKELKTPIIKHFFKLNSLGVNSDCKIETIKEKYSKSKGKELAILIHILDKLNLLEKTATKKRDFKIQFIRALKNDPSIKNISGVNDFFNKNVHHKIIRIDDDIYINTKAFIEQLIKQKL